VFATSFFIKLTYLLAVELCGCVSVFSWIADGSKQQFSVKASATSLRDVLIQALALRNIPADSGNLQLLVNTK